MQVSALQKERGEEEMGFGCNAALRMSQPRKREAQGKDYLSEEPQVGRNGVDIVTL